MKFLALISTRLGHFKIIFMRDTNTFLTLLWLCFEVDIFESPKIYTNILWYRCWLLWMKLSLPQTMARHVGKKELTIPVSNLYADTWPLVLQVPFCLEKKDVIKLHLNSDQPIVFKHIDKYLIVYTLSIVKGYIRATQNVFLPQVKLWFTAYDKFHFLWSDRHTDSDTVDFFTPSQQWRSSPSKRQFTATTSKMLIDLNKQINR